VHDLGAEHAAIGHLRHTAGLPLAALATRQRGAKDKDGEEAYCCDGGDADYGLHVLRPLGNREDGLSEGAAQMAANCNSRARD
jgi:hypothetical protein